MINQKTGIRKWLGLLGTLLFVQLGLIAVLNIDMTQTQSDLAATRWFSVDTASIDKLVIEAAEKTTLSMVKKDNVWVLPEHYNFPVGQTAFNALVTKLSTLKEGRPIATTSEAAKRFKVAQDDFERKLTFYNKDSVQEILYLGTSPGLRKVYARKDGQENIYAIELNAFDASTKPVDWFDYASLTIARDKIKTINLAGLTLTQSDQTWTATPLDEKEKLNVEALDRWLGELLSLRFEAVLGPDAPAGNGEAVVTVQVDDKVIAYNVTKIDEGKAVVFKRSDSPFYLKMSLEQAAPLLTIARAQLVTSSEESDSAASNDSNKSITIGQDEQSIKALQDMLNAPMGESLPVEDAPAGMPNVDPASSDAQPAETNQSAEALSSP